jgi:hypothetical protein
MAIWRSFGCRITKVTRAQAHARPHAPTLTHARMHAGMYTHSPVSAATLTKILRYVIRTLPDLHICSFALCVQFAFPIAYILVLH